MTEAAAIRQTPIGSGILDGVRFLSGSFEPRFVFSICTLLKRRDSYKRLVASFVERGFTSDRAEFVALDNSDSNRFDGFGMAREVLSRSSGKYIVFCHDDIELTDDGFNDLLDCLEQLEAVDNRWVIAGVAGGVYRPDLHRRKQIALHLSDIYGERRERNGPFPCRVETVDECFFVMPRERAVLGSLDLSGFHFFGSDICLQAEISGGTCYVIPFHLMHHGQANRGSAFEQGKRALAQKYGRFFPGRHLHTTTLVVDFDGFDAKAWASGVASGLKARGQRALRSLLKNS